MSGNTTSPQSPSGLPISELTTSLVAPAVLAGVLYGMARQGYVEFYRVLGLTPEQVGLSQIQVVAQVGAILGSYLLVLLSVTLVGIFAYHVSVAADRPGVAAPTDYKTALTIAAVILIPMAVLGAVAWFLPEGTWQSRAGRATVLILAAVAWMGLTRPGPSLPTSKRYRIVVAAIYLTSLAAAALFTHGQIAQYIWYTFLACVLSFGLLAAYYHEGPSGSKLRLWLVLGLPIFGFAVAAGATRGSLQLWFIMAMQAYTVGVFLARLGVNRGVLVQFLARLFPRGIPRVNKAVVFLLLAALSLGFMLNFWRDAREDGEALLRGTPPKKALFEVLNYQVFPTRLLQVGDDNLAICDDKHEFYLLGRNGDESYIVVLRKDRSSSADVLSVPLDNYVPVTGTQSPGTCAEVPAKAEKSNP